MKSYIARFGDGYTTRIDAKNLAHAKELAQEIKRESGTKVKKVIPMTPDWMFKIK